MEELITSIHIHTKYSDGSSNHAKIARIAAENNMDVIIITDHNILVNGMEGYYHAGDKKVILLCGEEIHDPYQNPQKNHLIVLGVKDELSKFSHDLNTLTRQVEMKGGLAFIAHPFEDALPAFHESRICWDDWEVQNIHGIEIWNQLSELKTTAKNWLHTIFLVFFPQLIGNHPHPEALKQWDTLLAQGRKVVAFGGADAHALIKHIGPFTKKIFPYEFHFRGVTTHLLVENPISGDLLVDRQMILDSFRKGHAFVAYDLPYPSKGFRFSAMNIEKEIIMGDTIELIGGITLKIHLPIKAECRLIKDGEVINVYELPRVVKTITHPGIYRVECYLDYLGKKRGWIFSNPITITK